MLRGIESQQPSFVLPRPKCVGLKPQAKPSPARTCSA